MVVITEKKTIEAVRFETIIKRCPICLIDTEQTAFYAKAPDLGVTVGTDTEPSVRLTVQPKSGHKYGWDVLARCSVCNYTYRVMGVPRMKVKDIPQNTSQEEHELALICCDVCYNEYYRYTIGDVFINLSKSGKVYLCDEHAREAEQERKRAGSYAALIARLSRWSSIKEKPIALGLDDGRKFILKRNHGINTGILLLLSGRDSATQAEISRSVAKKADMSQISDSISYLKGMGLVEEKTLGLVVKRQYLSLTEEGKVVAGALGKKYNG